MLLLAVSLQTMKEYAWHSDRLAVLLPDCVMVLIAEVLVDWVCIMTWKKKQIYKVNDPNKPHLIINA